MPLYRGDLDEITENMKQQIGIEELLDNLCSAMSIEELQENLEYIDRMHDLNNFTEEEEA